MAELVLQLPKRILHVGKPGAFSHAVLDAGLACNCRKAISSCLLYLFSSAKNALTKAQATDWGAHCFGSFRA